MKSETVMFDSNMNCLNVQRQLHPGLFDNHYISMNDVSELWRKSPYAVFRLLRCSKLVNIQAYKLWLETYYQISVLVLPQKPR